MPELLQAPLGAAAGWLLTYLLHSSVLIAGAWLVTRLLRSRPATREVVWRVALLGGIVTATGGAVSQARAVPGLGAVPGVRVVALDNATQGSLRTVRVRALALEGEDVSGIVAAGALESVRRRALLGRVPAATAECRMALRGAPPMAPGWIERVDRQCGGTTARWYHLLVVAWLAGAGVASLALLRGRLALRNVEATLEEAGERAEGLLAGIRAGRRVRLVGSDALSAPCVLPGRRIGLPARCEAELTGAELRAVLAHELAHVDRHDVAWSGLLRALGAVLWIQPLNRLAIRGALGAAEEICDDWALTRTGERVGLATSISRVAAWVAEGMSDPVPVSMVGRRDGPVAARVRRILGGSRAAEPRWLGLVAAVVIAVPLVWVPAVALRDQGVRTLWIRERVVSGSSIEAGRPMAGPTEVEVHVTRFDRR
jgi:beta-lactamase regulating signal transducer with metallopeptidase domain